MFKRRIISWSKDCFILFTDYHIYVCSICLHDILSRLTILRDVTSVHVDERSKHANNIFIVVQSIAWLTLFLKSNGALRGSENSTTFLPYVNRCVLDKSTTLTINPYKWWMITTVCILATRMMPLIVVTKDLSVSQINSARHQND